MKLKNVIKNIDNIKTYGNLNLEITNITSDSRNIEENGLFFAIKGFVLDGTKFIKSAIENGANSVVVDTTTNIQELNIPKNITVIVVEDIRYALGICSCNLYDNPSSKLKVIPSPSWQIASLRSFWLQTVRKSRRGRSRSTTVMRKCML